MVTVIIKQIIENGKWNCSTTFKGYDHLEVDDTIEKAQNKMTDKLRKWGYEKEVKFESPKPYIHTSPIPGRSVSNFRLPGIDTNMV